MSEPEKGKIQVRKPAGYESVPLPLPAPNGGVAQPETAALRTATPPFKPLALRPAEDAKDPEGDLVSAAGAVFRALTARIAYHEKQAQRLREALAPFGSVARQSAAPTETPDGDAVRALLRYADVINNQGGRGFPEGE